MKLIKRLLSLGVVLAILITLVAACSRPEEKKQKFFNKGKSLYEKGDFVKAGLEFRNAVQIDPKFADAYYMLGMVELKKKDPNPKKAYGAFSKAVELNPKLQDAQIQLGNLYMMARQPDKALEKAETVLKMAPGSEDAQLLKAAALLALKNSAEALALLQDMQQRDRKSTRLNSSH
jgi:tetratricopeptide (TPR) repeat protein